MYATYRFGAWLLKLPPRAIDFTLSLENLLNNMQGVWKPLLVGSLITGILAAAIGFVLVRLAWRIYIVRQRRARTARHGA
jgi:uncharacterized protein (DUF2062 family)